MSRAADRPPRSRPRWQRAARTAIARTDEALAATDRAVERAVRATEPPTDKIPVWQAPDGVDRTTAQGVVDLTGRVGVSLMATGAPAAEVVNRMLAVARAYGLRSVHVDVTFSSLTVSYHRGPDHDPMTIMRVVPSRAQDFTRYERLRRLIDSVVAQPRPVDEVRDELDAVISAPHPYRRWVVTMSVGLLAASAAIQLGGGVLIAVISLLTSAATSWVQGRLGRLGFAPFFTQAVGAAIPTAVAVGVTLLRAGGQVNAVSPSLVVAAGIVVLLSGLSFVGAAQDAIEGFYVTAGARLTEVVVLTLGIVVGIFAVLSLAGRLGVPMAIQSRTVGGAGPALAVLASVSLAACFAVSAYAVGRAVALCALAGGTAWVLFVVLQQGLGAGRPVASAVAAFVVGFPAQLVARRLGVPGLVVTTAAILPLVPGRLVYQGIFQVVSNPSTSGLSEGLATLLEAFQVGVALAAGVSLGLSLARLFFAIRRGQRRRRAPGAASGA